MMEADVTATQADEASTLAWSGVSVAGTFSPITGGMDIDADQLTRTSEGEFVAVKSLFTAGVPPVNSVVAIGGVNFFVVDPMEDDAAVTLRVRRVVDRTYEGGGIV